MTNKIEELWKLACKGEITFEEYQKSYSETVKNN